MSRFLETIKVQHRRMLNLDYHQHRVARTMAHFFPGADVPVISDKITIPDWLDEGTFKCRITYGTAIGNIEFESYTPRTIHSLKVVFDDEIDYSFKFADRNRLHHLTSMKGNCDDILIIKNGLITDTSYCNILFFDGDHWVTPKLPLLHGTCRQRLLDKGLITAKEIRHHHLCNFSQFMLINALLDFDETRIVDINRIIF